MVQTDRLADRLANRGMKWLSQKAFGSASNAWPLSGLSTSIYLPVQCRDYVFPSQSLMCLNVNLEITCVILCGILGIKSTPHPAALKLPVEHAKQPQTCRTHASKKSSTSRRRSRMLRRSPQTRTRRVVMPTFPLVRRSLCTAETRRRRARPLQSSA